MRIKLPPLLLHFCLVITSFAQAPDRQQFIRVEAPAVALAHVRVIDGTGAAPRDDQTIVISGGKILSIEASDTAKAPVNAQVLDLTGYTVLPGHVGMHGIAAALGAAPFRHIKPTTVGSCNALEG
jgi:predicted amidohydrolase YtcJ